MEVALISLTDIPGLVDLRIGHDQDALDQHVETWQELTQGQLRQILTQRGITEIVHAQ